MEKILWSPPIKIHYCPHGKNPTDAHESNPCEQAHPGRELHLPRISQTVPNQYSVLHLFCYWTQGEPQASCSAQLNVAGWFETEPFQKIRESLPEVTSAKLGDDVKFVVGVSSEAKCRSVWTHCGKPVPPNSKRLVIQANVCWCEVLLLLLVCSRVITLCCCIISTGVMPHKAGGTFS